MVIVQLVCGTYCWKMFEITHHKTHFQDCFLDTHIFIVGSYSAVALIATLLLLTVCVICKFVAKLYLPNRYEVILTKDKF